MISVHYQVKCNGSSNGPWNCVRHGSRKRVQQVMWFYGIWDHLVYMRRNLTSHRPFEGKQQLWGSRRSRFPEEASVDFSEISGGSIQTPGYEFYIAAGSCIDWVVDTDGDQVPSEGYNDGRAHITVVTNLHKRVFCPKALIVSWHKPREKKALEHRAHGRVLWLDFMTHEEERISIIDIH